MYRPPENTNRVKSIKSKFENNIQNDSSNVTAKTDLVKNKLLLSRQLSDPAKRNIKRTPAFRLDVSATEKRPFERDSPNNRSHYESKVRQFSALRSTSCDKVPIDDSTISSNVTDLSNVAKPVLIKSKSSHDFADLRSKFDGAKRTDLYTEPIPKCLRVKNSNDLHSYANVDIYNAETLKLEKDNGLTDTLKTALRRPLPVGPAPRKPPRTFVHTPPPKKSPKDHRYMLHKLEAALRNHKIKQARPKNKEVSTSGDDSDDSLLFRSKSSKRSPSSLNLMNCLKSKTEEPVYAEPFGPAINGSDPKMGRSLYYMSTSLLCDVDRNMTDNNKKIEEGNAAMMCKQMSAENSSLSSFTSDLDSAASTPTGAFAPSGSPVKIRQLIDAFENSQHKPSDNRIDTLKDSLQKTLDNCFDSNDENEHTERKVSVDRIIHKLQSYVKTMPKYKTPMVNKEARLFYCCLIVDWVQGNPHVKFKFPPNVAVPHRIEDLCYPEATSGPLDQSDNAQCYSLVLTNDRGERTFGYCRRVIPENQARCIPLVYCILSKHRAPRFYRRILQELESRHGISDALRDYLISEFYFSKFPRPGESIRIDMSKFRRPDTLVLHNGYGVLNHSKGGDPPDVKELVLTLHPDARYEEADLRPLHELPAEILLKVFASLLMEQKVIFISCVLSKLSCCVDALQSILYPFVWPHTFLPILPQGWWDVVESPTPVICGILSVAVVNQHQIENGIVVDLDEQSIVSEDGDVDRILSDSLKKIWMQALALAKTEPRENYVHSVYLGDAYIRVFVASLKHYKSHVVGGKFDKDGFIRGGKTRGIRRFLKCFVETTMFHAFIEAVISDPESVTLFDQKIEMYGSEQSNLILTKLKDWRK